MSDNSSKLQDRIKIVKAGRRDFLKRVGAAGVAIATFQTLRLDHVGGVAYACGEMNASSTATRTALGNVLITRGRTFAAMPNQTCGACIGISKNDVILGVTGLQLTDREGKPIEGFGKFTSNESLSSVLDERLNPLFGTELRFFAFTAPIEEPGVRPDQGATQTIILDLVEDARLEEVADVLNRGNLLVNGEVRGTAEKPVLGRHVTIIETRVSVKEPE